MDESETLGIGEMDDINLPLDEIIERKAQQDRGAAPWRPARRSPSRRFGTPSRRQFPRFHRQDHAPAPFGTGVFHGDTRMETPWTGYEEGFHFPGPHVPPMEFDAGQYWPQQHPHLYQQPPPPPSQQNLGFRQYRNRQPGGPLRGGIRKPVLDRRRGQGFRGRRPYHRPRPERVEAMEKSPPKEDKCTMTFEKGNAVIKFNEVSSQGDLVLTTDGHQDGRFLKALNDVLGLINVEILAEEDRADSWKVKDGYALYRYYDGIAIKGKGDPTKNRAELIKKAFEQPNPKALEATLASNLAARRLGLTFDPITPAVTPGSSIRITQDQQLTRTSKYSISFVEQNKEQEEEAHPSPPCTFPPQGHVQSGFPPY